MFVDILHFEDSDMASNDPKVWMKWLKEIEEEEEEILGESDPDEDDGDCCEENEHNTDSEEDADETVDEHMEEWFCHDDVPCYIARKGTMKWKKIAPPRTRTRAHNIFEKKTRACKWSRER